MAGLRTSFGDKRTNGQEQSVRTDHEPEGGLLARLLHRRPPAVVEQVPPMEGALHMYLVDRVQNAPVLEGVIALWERTTLIYLSSAPQALGGIRGALAAARRGAGCVQSATHFQYEVMDSPEQRLHDLLAEHQLRHGSLPRCNDRAAAVARVA